MRWVTAAAVATFAVASHGKTAYQDEIPNGKNVQRNGVAWPGVGHDASAGGGARNVFGTAFQTAGLTWTTALCQEDSDGDGFSNGEELGDPGCNWTKGGTPTITSGITHPGFADSKPAAPSSNSSNSSAAPPPPQQLAPPPSPPPPPPAAVAAPPPPSPPPAVVLNPPPPPVAAQTLPPEPPPPRPVVVTPAPPPVYVPYTPPPTPAPLVSSAGSKTLGGDSDDSSSVDTWSVLGPVLGALGLMAGVGMAAFAAKTLRPPMQTATAPPVSRPPPAYSNFSSPPPPRSVSHGSYASPQRAPPPNAWTSKTPLPPQNYNQVPLSGQWGPAGPAGSPPAGSPPSSLSRVLPPQGQQPMLQSASGQRQVLL